MATHNTHCYYCDPPILCDPFFSPPLLHNLPFFHADSHLPWRRRQYVPLYRWYPLTWPQSYVTSCPRQPQYITLWSLFMYLQQHLNTIITARTYQISVPYHKQATTIFFPCFTVHFNTPPLSAHTTPKVETMSLNNTLILFFNPPTHLSWPWWPVLMLTPFQALLHGSKQASC